MNATLKNRLDTIVQMAMAILEDELRLDDLRKEGKAGASNDGKIESTDISTFFTNKELISMPKLKDGKIRRRRIS